MPVNQDDGEEVNFATFRDSLFEAIVEKSTPTTKPNGKRHVKARKASTSSSLNHQQAVTADLPLKQNDPAELADFSDFIASEIFPNLPGDLRSLSHRTLQGDQNLADKWSLPLSLSTLEELSDMIVPSVADSLTAYGIIKPPESDLQSFISPVISSYVSAATIPPPKWIETKVTACEICDRDWVPMTYHHLIPKEVHAKAMKRSWHEEHMLNSVAWLCRACHSFVHKIASNEELAKEWFTVERICSREDVQKWASWVGRVRWKKS